MSRVRAVVALLAVAALAPVRMAGQQAAVEHQSLMTTPVWLYSGGQEVLQGTGFFYANAKAGRPNEIETVFLVTNYHVVTGHAPRVRTAAAGDRIRFALHVDENDLENIRWLEVPLYDLNHQPLWITSQDYPNADVVLIPLPAEAYTKIQLYVFTEAHTKADLKIRPTSGATLLGYPFSFYDRKHSLPIWKTGHIASEPDVDFEGQPIFLVDVSAFPGMSGSPVLAVATGIYESEDNVMRSGRVLKLLGIFSSMPIVRETRPGSSTDDQQTIPSEISLQLGYVWKASVIAEIAKRYQPR